VTPLDLEAIEARAAAATPGGKIETVCACGDVTWTGMPTWVPAAYQMEGRWHMPRKCGTHAEALLEEAGALRRLMHDSRADIPALVAEVKALREVVAEHEWIYGIGGQPARGSCPDCLRERGQGHGPGCNVARVLGRTR
jgi:hypothetical protein